MTTLTNITAYQLRPGDLLTRVVEELPGSHDPASRLFSQYEGGGLVLDRLDAPEDPPENGVSRCLMHFRPGPALEQFKADNNGRDTLLIATSWKFTAVRTMEVPPNFQRSGRFYGWSHVPPTGDGEQPTTTVEFRAYTDEFTPLPAGTNPITALMVAEALNGLLVDNGWPPISFMGPQVDAVLNEMPTA
ncbi:hypothetical protein ABZS76_33045 [Streptomyces sp. NPDC005562]|uniref:hypothetical protein n=1 Tax=Streptomyces sp. NPDC005562 TaxID=3154890 RepID=UPI0033BD8F29